LWSCESCELSGTNPPPLKNICLLLFQSAKLPPSFPERVEQNPSYLHYRSERGRVLYNDDVYVGYRHYETVGLQPLFSFGHGLSYTSFRLSELEICQPFSDLNNIKEESLEIIVTFENVGSRSGTETGLVYISPPVTSSVGRPVRELKGFNKVTLQTGESKKIRITVPICLATSFWDESISEWMSEAGEYAVSIVGTGDGNSISAPFTISKSRSWTGLYTPVIGGFSAPKVNGTIAH
jgi:beta-glucosidase